MSATRSSPQAGVAGASARRKAERLREERLRLSARRSRPGRVLAAVLPSARERRLRAEQRSWETGADGEERLARLLARRCPNVPMLHDRRAPHSRANIDHIAVAPSGVYVIDCKRYRGRVEVAQPLFGKAKLKINGRDRTELVSVLDTQVGHVKSALARLAEDVPTHGCLCFLAPEGLLAVAGLPTLWTLNVDGYPLYDPRRLARRLNRHGPLTTVRARALAAALAEQFPLATSA